MLVHDGPPVHRDEALRGGRAVAKGAVRAHGVVALPPGIEGALASRVIGERAPAQQFGFEGAVKALVLALGLGVIGAAMTVVDAQRSDRVGEGVPVGLGVVEEVLDKLSAKPGHIDATMTLDNVAHTDHLARQEAQLVISKKAA